MTQSSEAQHKESSLTTSSPKPAIGDPTERTCHNCQAITSRWRRHELYSVSCHPCFKYLNTYGQPPPKTPSQLICGNNNCRTLTSSNWASDGQGALLCNACVLEYRQTGKLVVMSAATSEWTRHRRGNRRNRKGRVPPCQNCAASKTSPINA